MMNLYMRKKNQYSVLFHMGFYSEVLMKQPSEKMFLALRLNSKFDLKRGKKVMYFCMFLLLPYIFRLAAAKG